MGFRERGGAGEMSIRPTPDSRLQIPDSRLPIPDSLFPDSRLLPILERLTRTVLGILPIGLILYRFFLSEIVVGTSRINRLHELNG